ncbi:hypothetical protein Tco_0134983 [Tanacetum coccineum]
MPLEDEVFPAEEQPLPAAVSPTADSPRYIADSDPKEDEEDPEEDPAEYPVDGGDDEDDDDELSDDDEDDDDDVEDDEDEEEEEEHPDLADSVPPPVHCVTARMSVRAQTPISLPSDIEVARRIAIPTPPPSPLSPLSSPLPQILSPLPQILSPPLPVSPPPLPASPTYALGYRAAMIRLRAETPSTFHPLPSSTPPSRTPPLLPIPLPTPSPPMLLPSTDCRADTWDEMVEDMQGTPTVIDVARLSQQMTDFVTTLKMLRRDRCAHAYTTLLIERDARLSHEAWRWSMEASDTVRSDVMALRTTV